MNTQKGGAKYNNFHLLLDSGCISAIVIRRLITKLNPKIYDVMQWHTQAGNITTNIRLKNIFYLT